MSLNPKLGSQADILSKPMERLDSWPGGSLPGKVEPFYFEGGWPMHFVPVTPGTLATYSMLDIVDGLVAPQIDWPKEKTADDIRADIVEALGRPIHHDLAVDALQAPLLTGGYQFFKTRDVLLADDIGAAFSVGKAFNIACGNKLYMAVSVTEIEHLVFTVAVVPYGD
jgi:hypothetical protein